MGIPVALEVGRRRVFAAAIDWPGWCRGAPDGSSALEALVACGPRYRDALALAGVDFVPPSSAADLLVVERIAGDAGTDFGAPTVEREADGRPVDLAEAVRLAAIVTGAWAAFDQAAAAARGRPLRTGPRGGGRGLERIVAHAAEAEAAYLVKLGAGRPMLPGMEPSAAWPLVRERALAALAARAAGHEVEEPSRTARRWPLRYWATRAAWHSLDHAWEIEDRLEP